MLAGINSRQGQAVAGSSSRQEERGEERSNVVAAVAAAQTCSSDPEEAVAQSRSSHPPAPEPGRGSSASPPRHALGHSLSIGVGSRVRISLQDVGRQADGMCGGLRV